MILINFKQNLIIKYFEEKAIDKQTENYHIILLHNYNLQLDLKLKLRKSRFACSETNLFKNNLAVYNKL